MPLSKHYIDARESAVSVDTDGIASCIENNFPEVVFALIHGSAKSGVIGPKSDLDLAVFAEPGLSGERFLDLAGRIGAMHSDARCDLGTLNQADPVYAFEALKGHVVYCRDRQVYSRFFSETCRRYEAAMASYARQHRYRTEAG